MLPALPSTLRAGDTLADTFSLSDYPAPTWVLTFTLINSAAKQTVTCSASGTDHAMAVTAATTAGWAAGTYSWSAHATSGAARYTVNTGTVEVLPDLAAATTYDNRTPARKALDAVDAALAAYGSKAYLQSIQIGERQQTFQSPSEFLAFRDRLRREVAGEDSAERMRQGLGTKNRLLVRFTR